MFPAAILVLASTTAAPQATQGVELASANVTVEILDPVAVRQGSGLERRTDAPRPQVTRRGGTTLFEFQ